MTKIEITTDKGICPSYVSRPSGQPPWPAVLVFMDGIGIRPAMLELGERLATYGYFVLLPDLFYRSGPYEPMDARTVFSDPAQRKVLMEKFFALATQANIMADTRAFLNFLAVQPDVKAGGIGTTGYCMGGLMSLAAAGTYPDRIVATASLSRRPPGHRRAGQPAPPRPEDQIACLYRGRHRRRLVSRRHEAAS